ATDKSREEIERLSSIPEVTLDTEAAEITDELGVLENKADETETAAAPAVPAADRQDDQKEEKQPAVKKDRPETLTSVRKQPAAGSRKTKAVVQGSVLRVDSRRIDSLLNLVGETIIIKAAFNQVSNGFGESLLDLENAEERYRELLKGFFEELPHHITRLNNGSSVKEVKENIQERFEEIYTVFESFEGNLKANIAKFRNSSQVLSRVTGELQEGVMKIRMVPISQLFSRFPRLVRDLTHSLKKKVNLVIEGEDTELDKSVIEDILDPLIHCVRNSIDHGLESPGARKKAGKDEQGEIRLSAHNEGNSIIIVIADDGKGIEVETVRNKAIERGLIHPDKILTDVEAFNLIFEPGFSTAGKITSVSGRGVGLDVVRRQVEKLNGSVAVWSKKGKGSTFTIKLPLTLAIIQGLLVRISGEIYIIPITSVIESLRIRPSEINLIDNYEVFNLRDDVLSLVRLDRLFKIEMKQDRSHLFVVVVGIGDKRVGLMVESLIGEEDVVIKPLRDRYTESPGIAGATILGNGQVSLILDVGQLLEFGLKQELEARMSGTTIK
ncbi:MAG TPA: chemotaxis protein CheA, partial [bacterium]|nr:chemotaxis protein CheA [bacterium]